MDEKCDHVLGELLIFPEKHFFRASDDPDEKFSRALQIVYFKNCPMCGKEF